MKRLILDQDVMSVGSRCQETEVETLAFSSVLDHEFDFHIHDSTCFVLVRTTWHPEYPMGHS